MRLVDRERIHDRNHVVARDVLTIVVWIGRNVGRGIAALAVSHAAMLAAEIAHLRLPAAIVAGVFMDEDDRRPAADLLDVELGPVCCGDFRHF
jgi:hypothetical protein